MPIFFLHAHPRSLYLTASTESLFFGVTFGGFWPSHGLFSLCWIRWQSYYFNYKARFWNVNDGTVVFLCFPRSTTPWTDEDYRSRNARRTLCFIRIACPHPELLRITNAIRWTEMNRNASKWTVMKVMKTMLNPPDFSPPEKTWVLKKTAPETTHQNLKNGSQSGNRIRSGRSSIVAQMARSGAMAGGHSDLSGTSCEALRKRWPSPMRQQ